jgi:ParB/RepB/Spo0J family partition protein
MPKDPQFLKIDIRRIRPNPLQPRKVITQSAIDLMVASLKAIGQQTPAKVRPLTEAEKAVDPDHDYELIGGHIRHAGALKAGFTTLDCLVLDLTPEQARKAAILDNMNREMNWLELAESIEDWLKAEPKTTQQTIGDTLEIGQDDVSRKMSILKFLTPAARAAIYGPSIKAFGGEPIPQKVVGCLTALGDPDKVEKALNVAIEHKMTIGDAQKLVKWVQAGNPPETYAKAPKQPKPKPTPSLPPEAINQLVELAEQVGVAKGRGEDPIPAQGKLKAFRESLALANPPSVVKEPSHSLFSRVGFALLCQKVSDEVKKLFNTTASTGPEQGAGTSSGPSANGNNGPSPSGDPLAQSNHVPQREASAQTHAGSPKEPSGSSPTANAVGDGSTHSGSQQAQKEMKPIVHWFKKFVEKLAKLPWKELGKVEHHVCRKLAHAMVPLHSSSHSGHSHHQNGSLSQGLKTAVLTILHWAVYTLLQFGFLWAVAMFITSHWFTGLKPWVETPFRFTARLALVDFPNWLIPYALIHWVMALVVGVLLLWGYGYALKVQRARMIILGAVLTLIWIYGRRWSEAPLVPWSQSSTEVSTPAPETTPVMDDIKKIVSISKPIQKPAPTSAPVMVYQPAISFQPSVSPTGISSPLGTQEDPKCFELEIAAIAPNRIVKDFSVSPDEGMPGDLAVTRMQGVMDPDKYTMMIGSDKRIVLGINAGTTTLTIHHKSADPLNGFLGDGLTNIVLEDVTAIHISEISPQKDSGISPTANAVGDGSSHSGTQDTPIYQLSLISEGAKYPLTIQCNSTDDLRHLVSAMEYFIRNSRLGHDTPLTGMPYPSQGLVLNNGCVVDKLWANSPMDKAGVTLGDHLWSIGKVTSGQQSRNDLEAELQSPSPILFVASPAEWERALTAARVPGQSTGFRPRLRKIILEVGK